MPRKILDRLAVVLAMLGSLIAIAPASPAAASTCSTPGCGGWVTNNSGSGAYVRVANNWCWSNQSTYYGATLPCATTWSASAPNSFFLLGPGDNTNNYYYYYDTDAIRIDARCKVYWYNGTTQIFDNSTGTVPMWIKLNNWSGVQVTNSIGSGCVR